MFLLDPGEWSSGKLRDDDKNGPSFRIVRLFKQLFGGIGASKLLFRGGSGRGPVPGRLPHAI